MRSEIEQQQSLEATLREVMHLLERQALVKQVVARSDTRKPELAQSLVARQHAVELEKKLNRMHPADAAFVLESLNQEQRVAAWHLIRRDRRGSILLELAGPVRTSLVTLLDEHELVTLGRQMDADDFADLVQDLPPEHVEQVLAQLGTEQSAEVQSVLSFPEDSVGSLMHLDVVTVRDDVTLEDAISSLRRRRNLPQQFTSLVVVDRNNTLRGVLPLDRLVARESTQQVSDVMVKEPTYFLTTDPVDDAAVGVRALRPAIGARREPASASGRLAHRRRRARSRDAGYVQAVALPGRPERGRGPVRADLAKRPQTLGLARG